jgi:hypothetical protein
MMLGLDYTSPGGDSRRKFFPALFVRGLFSLRRVAEVRGEKQEPAADTASID